ncbi:hypothetical protein JCM14036_01400 [Desulfotomaculum defluvii]
MREEGIKAIWVRPYTRTTIDPEFDDKLKNILNRHFNPKAPNAVWVTDITYIYTISGFAYLTSVMDLFSRKIIGWHVSDSLSTEHVLMAIEKAIVIEKLVNQLLSTVIVDVNLYPKAILKLHQQHTLSTVTQISVTPGTMPVSKPSMP